jgi:hypothetical protein
VPIDALNSTSVPVIGQINQQKIRKILWYWQKLKTEEQKISSIWINT